MNKKQLILLLALLLIPLSAMAVTFDDMLVHKPSNTQTFWEYHYKNITWVSHSPVPVPDYYTSDEEADNRGQIDIGKVDLDGDGKAETIKVIWGPGVSDHSLEIELYKGKNKFGSFDAPGIQPNFKLEDIDGDKKLELVIWGAVADPKMSQIVTDKSKSFEGHSDPHLFKVRSYKLKQGEYKLFQEYISKKKYEPFCEEQPKK